VLPRILPSFLALAGIACSSSSTTAPAPTAAAAPAEAPPSTPQGPTVTGRLLRAPLLDGYESVDATDPDAKDAVESGGVMLRTKGNPKGTTLGVAALPGLPIDPSDPTKCTAMSTMSAQNSGMSLAGADVVPMAGTKGCRFKLTLAGTATQTWSYAWRVSPTAELAAMVVCAIDPSDAAAVRACEVFLDGVAPV
jgi:hypothetical protein